MRPEVLDSPNGRLSFLDFNQLTYSAQALCGEPALGLVLGQRLNVSAHGILGYAVLSSANLGKAIQFALKYYRVLGLAYELELVLDDGRAELRAVESMPLGAASVFAAEGLMATLYSIACFLVGEPLQDVRVGFAYPPPAHARRYAEVFGVAAEFEQPWHWLSMPSEYLERPMALANPATVQMCEQQCEALLATLDVQEGLLTRVRRLLLARPATSRSRTGRPRTAHQRAQPAPAPVVVGHHLPAGPRRCAQAPGPAIPDHHPATSVRDRPAARLQRFVELPPGVSQVDRQAAQRLPRSALSRRRRSSAADGCAMLGVS